MTRVLGALVSLLLATGLLVACGDDDSNEPAAGGTSSPDTTEDTSAEDAEPSGTLRLAEFAPVATFDPAGAQTSQSAYLYPVYDTLTRQGDGFEVQPGLATAWTALDPTTWQFELRDDVVFHDGATFDAEVVKANLEHQVATEGNPNSSVFATLDSVEVVDDHTVNVLFTDPSPSFPLEMSMVMGMMVSPNALGDDLTRAPSGSGPWIWQADESQSGVVEVYELNPDYWQPADQGVETIRVLTISDNDARLNALLAGDVDMAATVGNDQVVQAESAGMGVTSVAANLQFLIILDREGERFAPLADERVRQAIGYAIDREGFLEAVAAGQGDAIGGFYGPQFDEWYNPDLDDMYEYDPERARELLAEAGYADGFDLQMPVMPNIVGQVEAVVQMLGQVGIRVQLDQIQAGQIGGYVRGGDAGITWYRGLIYYPGKTYGDFVGPALNPFALDDVADLREMVEAANASDDEAARKAIFDELGAEFMDRGIVFPLVHGRQNAAWAPHVTGDVLLGLNMQAPLPYGLRVDG